MGFPTISKLRKGHGLGVVRTMPEFRDLVDDMEDLSPEEKATLVTQAEILIKDYYVHLPHKRAMYAVDPIQLLALLRHRMGGLRDLEFHSELLWVFRGFRDLHTRYVLPNPLKGRIAFLGVLLECFQKGDEPGFLVSKVATHLVAEATLEPGVEVTHWNGTPIRLAVARNADRERGGNPAARLANGLANMTLRSLSVSLPPEEDWVDLRYATSGGVDEARLLWRTFDSAVELISGAEDPGSFLKDLRTPLRYQVGVDPEAERLRRVRKGLFSPAAVKEEARVAKHVGRRLPTTPLLRASGIIPTSRPDELTARILNLETGTFGYLRIWTFMMKDGKVEVFLEEVIRLIKDELPQQGLIIDVRGNPGGYIIAAEFLLQLFTPRTIEPEPTQFISNRATLELTGQVVSMRPWNESIRLATETGALYSKAIPLASDREVNSVGQLYFGPVVLVVDPLCYSACDMFAAGFRDHEIGTVLGVGSRTGAGGANVLTHEQLREAWPEGPFSPLPKGAEMSVSLRRTLRVKDRRGQPVEDLGVSPDSEHQMTQDDLMSGNGDLLKVAGKILSEGTVRWLDARSLVVKEGVVRVELIASNITEVDLYLNDRPKGSYRLVDGKALVEVHIREPGPYVLTVQGFHKGNLVARRLFPL